MEQKMTSEKKRIDKIIVQIRENLQRNKETDSERISKFNSIIPGCRNPLIVKTALLEKLAREIWIENKDDLVFFLNICDLLWNETSYYEEQKIVIFLLEKLGKKYPEDLLSKIMEYYPRLYTWDLVDQFGMRLCSELLKNDFSYFKKFSHWSASEYFWIRRLSLVCLVRLRNSELNSEQWSEIKPMLERLWEDEEYYVYKAMSWCLRELSKSNPKKVEMFLTERLSQKSDIKHINRTFVKDCIKKLPENQGLEILNLL
jgi:3-methyladenine DNA glycosylase AlkD